MSKIIFLVIAVVLVIVLKEVLDTKIGRLGKSKPLYKYKKKDFLITRAEHEFFDILVEAVGGKYRVFTQVHLPTVLDYKVTGQNWKGAFNHINGKSVDFVICDKALLKPLLAIELDDKSHERPDRIERDSKVEAIFEQAGLPLIRFKNPGFFNKEEIKSKIEKALAI